MGHIDRPPRKRQTGQLTRLGNDRCNAGPVLATIGTGSTIEKHGLTYTLIPEPDGGLWVEVFCDQDDSIIVAGPFDGDVDDFSEAVDDWIAERLAENSGPHRRVQYGTVALFDHGARPSGEVSINRSDRCGEFVERGSGA